MRHHLRFHSERVSGVTVAALALAIASLALALGVSLSPVPSRAAEIVPSYGMTHAVGGDEFKGQVGLALRGDLIPRVLQTEFGAAYRTETVQHGQLQLKQWPITASLLLTPLQVVYADAGVGWYHTTLDYKDDLLSDDTHQDFGVHVGGGVKVPVAPRVALDASGRWVMLQDQDSKLVPEKFDPSFWTLSLGLALKF